MATIRIQRLCSQDFELSTFLADIGKCLRYQESNIWIGFSMIVSNGVDLQYLNAQRGTACLHEKFHDRKEFQRLISKIENKTYSEWLNESFSKHEAFAESGFYAVKSVACNIWILK